jgi:hypothetical protein
VDQTVSLAFECSGAMAKVIFLVGLSGSGKTRKGKRMEHDDGLVWVEGIAHILEDGTMKNYESLVGHLKSGRNCVAEELQTLQPQYRMHLEAKLKADVPGLEVEFWFFENDLVKAARNLLSRPDEKKCIRDHLLMNCNAHLLYSIPNDPATVVLPIEEPTEYIDP